MNRLLHLLDRHSVRDEAAWRRVLEIADRTLCTPLLRDTPELPAWFQREIDVRIAKSTQRRTALIDIYRDAAQALEHSGVEFVLIKGFTHEVDAHLEPALRTQSDIDLLCQAHDVQAGQRALQDHGFEFHQGSELSDNHGRPLLKPHTWRWHGDYFDPTQPVPVEVHHTIWSAGRDRIATPGVESFWARRERMDAAGLSIPVFCEVDRIAIAALHLLRHVLRNNVRPGHASELAQMLKLRLQDTAFWEKWQRLHPPELRRLEVLAFQFVTIWFGGEMPPAPKADWDDLSPSVHSWFERATFSPMENLTQPNKDVVWLHLALLPRFADRWAVARRRLVPLRLPGAHEVIGESYAKHVANRSRYHALALARALWTGTRPSTTRSKASHTSD